MGNRTLRKLYERKEDILQLNLEMQRHFNEESSVEESSLNPEETTLFFIRMCSGIARSAFRRVVETSGTYVSNVKDNENSLSPEAKQVFDDAEKLLLQVNQFHADLQKLTSNLEGRGTPEYQIPITPVA